MQAIAEAGLGPSDQILGGLREFWCQIFSAHIVKRARVTPWALWGSAAPQVALGPGLISLVIVLAMSCKGLKTVRGWNRAIDGDVHSTRLSLITYRQTAACTISCRPLKL